MHITSQTRYDIQYLTMKLSGCINAPIEPLFITLRHVMDYLMHQQYEPIVYSRKKIFKTNESSI